VTGIPPPTHEIVPDTPSGEWAILVRAIQADGYLAAKASQPDGIGQAGTAAITDRKERRNRR
jgi:hypothetical protein